MQGRKTSPSTQLNFKDTEMILRLGERSYISDPYGLLHEVEAAIDTF